MAEKLLKIGEVTKLLGKRQSTIKYYTEIGILPYWQKDIRLARYYDRDKVIKCLKEIEDLKQKGLDIKQIIERFKKLPKQLNLWNK
jgi:DNA-binding transcriptional MerR regulator